ncbi:hypothetical protein EDB89DRAFT_2169592 [Lactarius sanguifluus]|nr:hypothetical protein EDB89DRAFT_2169592 [Lactarius sanguifluus]
MLDLPRRGRTHKLSLNTLGSFEHDDGLAQFLQFCRVSNQMSTGDWPPGKSRQPAKQTLTANRSRPRALTVWHPEVSELIVSREFAPGSMLRWRAGREGSSGNRNGTPLRGEEGVSLLVSRLNYYSFWGRPSVCEVVVVSLEFSHRSVAGWTLITAAVDVACWLDELGVTSLQPIGSVLRPVRQTNDVSPESSLVGFGFGRPSCIERCSIEPTNQLSSQRSPLFGGTRYGRASGVLLCLEAHGVVGNQSRVNPHFH